MNNSDIRFLPKADWRGYRLDMTYVVDGYYDTHIASRDGLFSASFEYKPHVPFIHKSGDDFLYADWWEDAEAFGLFLGDTFAGVIEVCPERWSNRLRVTEMWVSVDCRRRGYGSALMDHAKRAAVEGGFRCVILETQSCNTNAIKFYLSQGFELIGFDRCCYSNGDIENGEVRLEFGWFIA